MTTTEIKSLCSIKHSGVSVVSKAIDLHFTDVESGNLNYLIGKYLANNLYNLFNEVGGALLGYEDIEVKKPLLSLNNIDVKVKGMFYVFSPEPGKKLLGRVYAKSGEGVKVLVHDFFVASVICSPEMASQVAEGDAILFRVLTVGFNTGRPRMKGEVVEASFDVVAFFPSIFKTIEKEQSLSIKRVVKVSDGKQKLKRNRNSGSHVSEQRISITKSEIFQQGQESDLGVDDESDFETDPKKMKRSSLIKIQTSRKPSEKNLRFEVRKGSATKMDDGAGAAAKEGTMKEASAKVPECRGVLKESLLTEKELNAKATIRSENRKNDAKSNDAVNLDRTKLLESFEYVENLWNLDNESGKLLRNKVRYYEDSNLDSFEKTNEFYVDCKPKLKVKVNPGKKKNLSGAKTLAEHDLTFKFEHESQ